MGAGPSVWAVRGAEGILRPHPGSLSVALLTQTLLNQVPGIMSLALVLHLDIIDQYVVVRAMLGRPGRRATSHGRYYNCGRRSSWEVGWPR